MERDPGSDDTIVDSVDQEMSRRVLAFATAAMAERGKTGRFWDSWCRSILESPDKTTTEKLGRIAEMAGIARPDKTDWDDARAVVAAKGRAPTPPIAQPQNTPPPTPPPSPAPGPAKSSTQPADDIPLDPPTQTPTQPAPPPPERNPREEFGKQSKRNPARVRRDTEDTIMENWSF